MPAYVVMIAFLGMCVLVNSPLRVVDISPTALGIHFASLITSDENSTFLALSSKHLQATRQRLTQHTLLLCITPTTWYYYSVLLFLLLLLHRAAISATQPLQLY